MPNPSSRGRKLGVIAIHLMAGGVACGESPAESPGGQDTDGAWTTTGFGEGASAPVGESSTPSGSLDSTTGVGEASTGSTSGSSGAPEETTTTGRPNPEPGCGANCRCDGDEACPDAQVCVYPDCVSQGSVGAPYGPCPGACEFPAQWCLGFEDVGMACAPGCDDDTDCPALLGTDVEPTCVPQEGADAPGLCGLLCEVDRFDRRVCPVGMYCEGYEPGKVTGLCIWPETGVLPGPCDQLQCGAHGECVVNGDEPICECEDGYTWAEEGCVSACVDVECTEHASCSLQSGVPTCECDPGYASRPDGSCVDVTPCQPNPCTGAATVCTAVGESEYSCGCANPDRRPPLCLAECPGGSHTDGDSFEPNECPAQASALSATSAGSFVSANHATIGPAASDVDYYRVTSGGGVDWLLLDATDPLCERIDTDLLHVPSGNWRFATQLGSTVASTPWSCRAGATTDYSLGVVRFVTGSDLGNNSFSATPVTTSSVADTLYAGDSDWFEFAAVLPITLSHVGQGVSLDLDVFDGNTLLSSANSICPFSLASRPCAEVQGSGVVRVRVGVQFTPEWSATTADLTAWRVSW